MWSSFWRDILRFQATESSAIHTHLKNRLSNIDSNYFDRVHVVLPQVERCQPKYETDRAGRGRPSHHYIAKVIAAKAKTSSDRSNLVVPEIQAMRAKLNELKRIKTVVVN